MYFRALAVLAAVSLLVLPVPASGATAFDLTVWTIGGAQTTMIPRQQAVVRPVSDLVLSFGNDGTYRVDNSGLATYVGTFVARGKRAFKSTLSAPTLALYQTSLVDGLKTALGASSVSVSKFKVTSSGGASKDGLTIRFGAKAKMKCVATVAGVDRKITMTDVGSYSGPKQ